MEAKAILIHPPYQGVCGRHGREDQYVTPGGLTRFPKGSRDKRPYKHNAKWEAKPREWSDNRIVPMIVVKAT